MKLLTMRSLLLIASFYVASASLLFAASPLPKEQGGEADVLDRDTQHDASPLGQEGDGSGPRRHGAASNAGFPAAGADASAGRGEGTLGAVTEGDGDPLGDTPPGRTARHGHRALRRTGRQRLGGAAQAVLAGLRLGGGRMKHALVDVPVDMTKKYVTAPLYAVQPQPVKNFIDAVATNRGYQVAGVAVGLAVLVQYALVQMEPACDYFSPDYSAATCDASLKATTTVWSAWASEAASGFVANLKDLVADYYPGGK